jgi:hypothetical protein
VVFPWSTWAMMAMLRMLEFKSLVPFRSIGALVPLYYVLGIPQRASFPVAPASGPLSLGRFRPPQMRQTLVSRKFQPPLRTTW